MNLSKTCPFRSLTQSINDCFFLVEYLNCICPIVVVTLLWNAQLLCFRMLECCALKSSSNTLLCAISPHRKHRWSEACSPACMPDRSTQRGQHACGAERAAACTLACRTWASAARAHYEHLREGRHCAVICVCRAQGFFRSLRFLYPLCVARL